jgi:hypothetical protein
MANFMYRTDLLQQFQRIGLEEEDDDDEPICLAAIDLIVRRWVLANNHK